MFETIDLNFNTQVLAPFADLVPPAGKQYLPIGLKNIPDRLGKSLKTAFTAIFDEEPEEDWAPIFISYKGKIPKLYCATLYKFDSNSLVVKWGKKERVLTPNKDLLNTQTEILLTFCDVTIGRFTNGGALFTISNIGDYEELQFPVACSPAVWELGFNVADANRFLRKNSIDKLAELFSLPMTASPTGNIAQGDVFDNSVLPQDTSLEVIGFKPVSTSYGDTYIITVKAKPESGLETDTNVWAFSKIKQKLSFGATVSPENPGSLSFIKTKNDKGEVRYDCNFQPHWSNSEFNLQDVLTNWS